MGNWKSKIKNLVEEIDGFFDNLRTRLRRIADFDGDLTIAAGERLISTGDLPSIREEKMEDENAPSAREIGEESI